MATITLKIRTTKKGKEVTLKNIRFRVTSSEYDIYHKSSICATLADLQMFYIDGTPKNVHSNYNQILHRQIESEIHIIQEAHDYMLRSGIAMTSKNLEETIAQLMNESNINPYEGSLVQAFTYYANSRYERGYITEQHKRVLMMVSRQIERYLAIIRQPGKKVNEFSSTDITGIYDFLSNEPMYAKRISYMYPPNKIPKSKRASNTVSSILKKIKAFYQAMEDMGNVGKSPFSCMSKDIRSSLLSQQYDAPVFLRASEFDTIRETDVPADLQQCKDLFILQCSLGCRISDFSTICRDRICVNEEGIPFFRYVAKKTSGIIRDDVETPIMLFALGILKKYDFSFKLLNNISGQDGYNKKIKKLLEYCNISRKCKIFDKEARQNIMVPLYEFGSSKLCRKTHEDIMVKVQINLYTTGLHRVGSGAIAAYTNLELMDRFRMMCLAFGEPLYKVDENLNILEIEKGDQL